MASSRMAAVSVGWESNFFDGLAVQDRKQVLAGAKPRRFAANSVITNQGHPADSLFLLTKGRARYFFDEHGGRHILLHWLAVGELIGGMALLAKPASYLLGSEAVRECNLLVWDRATIRGLVAISSPAPECIGDRLRLFSLVSCRSCRAHLSLC